VHFAELSISVGLAVPW